MTQTSDYALLAADAGRVLVTHGYESVMVRCAPAFSARFRLRCCGRLRFRSPLPTVGCAAASTETRP
jgi:hypothetical protein